MGRGSAFNVYYFLHGWAPWVCLGLLALAVMFMWAAWKYREANRRRPRYVFHEGRLVGRVDPPRPHEFCGGWICWTPRHGRCTDD